MSRLTALVPAAVCAAALGRALPDDVAGRVRCIDEGSRALGLQTCCAPWSQEAEDAALLSELGEDGPSLSELGIVAVGPVEPGDGAVEDDAFGRLDAVATGLVRTPGAEPVMGLVSGPLGWGARQASGTGRGLPIDPVEAIDAASDLAADRIRALAGCGVRRIAVVELGAPDLFVASELAAEFHESMLRAAGHLRVELLLVVPVPIAGVASPAELGYERWVSNAGCSDGLGFLPQAAFKSTRAVARSLRRLSAASEVVTGPLGPDVGIEALRSAAALVSKSRGER